MKPFYKIVVNENDETGVDFNSFVDVPAHLKGFIAFGDGVERYQFNEEKRMVTGVFISVNTPIYRNSRDLGEHYVLFDSQTVEIIRKKFFKQQYNVNVNTMHDANKVVKGAILIDSYIVSDSDPKYPNVPDAFKSQRLQDGSWIGTYYIEDDNLWNDVKSGKFNGFSVEGWFEKKEVKVNRVKMSKEKKTIWQMLFNSDEPNAETFATATTADGVVVSYEGELAEGTALTVEADGTMIPAPEGEHQLTLEDGSVKIVMLNAEGVVESIADFVANEDETGDEMKAEVAEVMRKVLADTNERFNKLESENKALKAELEAIKEGDKFKANPKKVEKEEKGNYRKFLDK